MTINALVVDNNPVHLKAVSEILSQEGCRVVTASNGLEALEKIQDAIPDMLFTDLVMPMVDGEKLCRIVKGVEDYKSIFVVLLSAIILEDRERILSEIDFDVCIAKGSLQEMRNHLREALQQYEKKEKPTVDILGDGEERTQQVHSVAKELLLEKDHLLLMLENLSEGVIELSSNGRIVSLNSSAEEIWDIRKEDCIGKTFKSLAFGNLTAKIKKWCEHEIEEKGGKNLEILEDNPLAINGKILTASLLPIEHGNGFFALCIFRDISRQYYAEKKREEMDNAVKLMKKMEAMSFMAGGVAHDFNNLLTVICGNLDMVSVKDEAGLGKSNIEFINNAKYSAYSAVELVRKISNFSPFGIISRKKIAFKKYLQETVEQFVEENSDFAYSLLSEEDEYYVNIDTSQMGTAIHNVLQNCREAQSKRKVQLKLSKISVAGQAIRAGQIISPGQYAKLAIKDWGVGIERKNLHEIFDPYFSTKERSSLKGMGLGLTIVYATLRNHAGYAIVESELGGWTSVNLYIPLVDRSETGSEEKTKGILIIEDDKDLQLITEIMLQHLDYNPVSVNDAAAALELLRKDQDGSKKINVVLVNLFEGGQRKGVDRCQEFHDIDPELQVIVCSGSTFDPVMKNYKDFGFSGGLGIPYTIDDLQKVMSNL